MPRKTVMIFGTFDGLHAGHRDFFRQASRLGRVVAVVARGVTVQRIKGRMPLESERTRLAKVAACAQIAKARLGDPVDLLRPVEQTKPDLIALGFDQATFDLSALQQALAKRGLSPEIIRLKSFQPDKFKSSLLREQITDPKQDRSKKAN